MYKIHFFLLLLWINYHRPRGVGDNYIHTWINKQYITPTGDTLVRNLYVSGQFNQVLKEETFLHNKKNGLTIAYYPNGTIQEINYYLDGRPWDVISRADSNGKLMNPGDLHNGNGVRFFSDPLDIEPNCYETYKDGLPEGPFYWKSDLTICIKGELTYKAAVVQYVPAKKVTYTTHRGGITTAVFDTSSYRNIFTTDTAGTDLKVLSLSNDSLPESPKGYKYIGVDFDDPAIIPRGTWQVINTKTAKVMTTVIYDDNGNPIKVTQYDENGKFLSEKSFPSYNKRKW